VPPWEAIVGCPIVSVACPVNACVVVTDVNDGCRLTDDVPVYVGMDRVPDAETVGCRETDEVPLYTTTNCPEADAVGWRETVQVPVYVGAVRVPDEEIVGCLDAVHVPVNVIANVPVACVGSSFPDPSDAICEFERTEE
jgi:hypothetical protein